MQIDYLTTTEKETEPLLYRTVTDLRGEIGIN